MLIVIIPCSVFSYPVSLQNSTMWNYYTLDIKCTDAQNICSTQAINIPNFSVYKHSQLYYPLATEWTFLKVINVHNSSTYKVYYAYA